MLSESAAGRIVLSTVVSCLLSTGALAHTEGSVAGDRAALVALYNTTGGSNWRTSTNWLSDKPLSEWHGVETDGNGRVTELQLWSNDLRGTIPPALGDLTEMRELVLLGNGLTGRIPVELAALIHLRRLDLWANRLTGGIPAELGNLPDLDILSLAVNALTGEIPATLATATNLRIVFLSWNDLTGSVPEELGNLMRLHLLSLGSNSLSGPIPEALGNLESLSILDLSFNAGLSGSLPAGLVHLDRLTQVDIHGTAVCVPSGDRFKAWASRIRLDSSGLLCGTEPEAVPVIDLAAFYTPAAAEAAGGVSEVEALIDLWVAETNQAYLKSGVQQRVALLVREETPYVESASSHQDLDRLEDPSDGYLDGVHPIREIVGADLVHLFVGKANACGVARVAERADRAFGLTWTTCSALDFAHELGHNMGLSHDRYALCGHGYCDLPRPYPYGFGYVNQEALQAGAPSSAAWYTIMAWAAQCSDAGISCRQLPLFSDPDRILGGDPLGASGDREVPGLRGPSDSVRALNEVRHSVASFRQRVPRSTAHSPAAVGSLADRSLRVGSAAVVVQVSDAFTDPDGDALTYEAMSSVEQVATLQVRASQVTITPISPGLTTITVTATDAEGSNTTAWQQFAVAVEAASAVDYDRDDDGLIEIRTLAQLDAVRHDTSGAGSPSSSGEAPYAAAFPNRGVTMGCGGGACRGYELVSDLDFDTNRSGGPDAGDTYWNNGAGWVPIGHDHADLATTFEGNGHTIRNLFVHRDDRSGLFTTVGSFATVRRLELIGVDVTGESAGALAALNVGVVFGVHATGRVSGTESAGGLVENNAGSMVSTRAAAHVSSDQWAGGLVAWNAGEITGGYAAGQVFGDPAGGPVGANVGEITAGYATGHVEASESAGGLVGSSFDPGKLVASYSTARVVGGYAGGLVGGRPSSGERVTASYWDTDTSGQTRSNGGSGQTTETLQAPTGYNGLYRTWNLDLDGDARADDPWDFGTDAQYPALKADIDGDGRATWQEFGDQNREDSGGNGDGVGPGDAIRVNADCAENLCRARTGVSVTFEDTNSGSARSRTWDFGDSTTSSGRNAVHAWSAPGFYEVTLTVKDGASESVASLIFLVEASEVAGTCVADAKTLCLQDSRFEVSVEWSTLGGDSGAARVVHAGTNDSGLFRFFDRDNWEILVKVLEACALNGHVWVYGASTTDVGYSIRVTDTVTGMAKEYRNEPGQPAPAITDSKAFSESCSP